MSACEHCWGIARSQAYHTGRATADEYYIQMDRAERANAPCTQDTPEGAKARAGQFWDEERQLDRRDAASNERKP